MSPRTSHYIQSCLLGLLLSVTVSQTFFVFDDLGGLKDSWSVVCRRSLHKDLSDVFLRIRPGGSKTIEVTKHLHYMVFRIHMLNITSYC